MSVLKLFSSKNRSNSSSGASAGGAFSGRRRPSLSERESSEAWQGFTFTLGPGLLLGSCLGFLVILAWVFVFGVIVGRGLNPETQMPGASIMCEPPKPENEPKPDILKPEELTFLNDLKQPGGKKLPLPKPEKTQDSSAPEQPAPPPPPAPVQPVKPAPTGPAYNYGFQVAAYKSAEPANQLRKKLEALGLRSTLVQKGGIYRVQVSARGGETLGSEIKGKLAQVGVKDAIMSRKPVGAPAAPTVKPAAQAAKPAAPAKPSAPGVKPAAPAAKAAAPAARPAQKAAPQPAKKPAKPSAGR